MHRYKYYMMVAVIVIVVAGFARYAHLEEKHGPTPAETAPDEVMGEQLQKQLQEPLTELPENVSVEDLIKQKPDKVLTKSLFFPSFLSSLRGVPYFHNGRVNGLRVLSVDKNVVDFIQKGDIIFSIEDKVFDLRTLPQINLSDKKYISLRIYQNHQVILIKAEKDRNYNDKLKTVEDMIKQKPAKILTVKILKKDIKRWHSDEGYTHIRAVPYGGGAGATVLSVKPNGMFEFLQKDDIIISINDALLNLRTREGRKFFSGLSDKEQITFRIYRDNQVVLIKVERAEEGLKK